MEDKKNNGILFEFGEKGKDSASVEKKKQKYDKATDEAYKEKLTINGVNIEMDEIHARRSIPFTWAIDDILAPHYGLNKDELQYLKEYDMRFRGGE